MALQRVYVIREGGKNSRLVSAGTPAQAIRHVVKEKFTAGVASQSDLIELISGGIKVENAAQED